MPFISYTQNVEDMRLWRALKNVENGFYIDIGPGFRIGHLPGVIITGYVKIDRNFFIRQNTTIGIKTMGLDKYNLVIGDNVMIGAMSFVNKNIPTDTTFYNAR